MKTRSAFAVATVVAGCWLSACAESSNLPPAAPSALPEEKIGVLGLACPADVQTQSFDGEPVPVSFESPVTSGGQAPVAVGCTPEPGHRFDVGTAEVSCSASDALQQAAGCAFQVIVLGPPKLSATRFVAFGDSLTAGWVSSAAGARPEPMSSYPYLLERDLQSRYVTQTIQVVNAGAPGEEAADATARFRSVIGSQRPEVVLLMEGTNDLDVVAGGGADVAADALRSMVRYAQDAGADVFLMTIPPQLHTGAADLVASFNATIRAIAVRRRAVLVDVHDVLLRGACSGGGTTPCIGADGLHPTAEGYRLVAEELSRVILDRYDVEILPAVAGQPNAASSPAASGVGAPFPSGGHE